MFPHLSTTHGMNSPQKHGLWRLCRPLAGSVAAALIVAGLFSAPGARIAQATDAPGRPGITNIVAVDPTSVRVTWYNSADGDYGAQICLSCESLFALTFGTTCKAIRAASISPTSARRRIWARLGLM
jgi:hypothetical protein